MSEETDTPEPTRFSPGTCQATCLTSVRGEKGPRTHKKVIGTEKYQGDRLQPPHLMHCTYPPGRIYVEKTPEQCILSYRHSDRAKGGV